MRKNWKQLEGVGRVYCPHRSSQRSSLAATSRCKPTFSLLSESLRSRYHSPHTAAVPARYCTCGGMDRQRRGADGGIFRPHPYLVPPAKGRQGRIGHRAAHRPCAPSHSFNTTLAPTPPPLSLRKVSRRPQSSPNPGSDCARSDHSGVKDQARLGPMGHRWMTIPDPTEQCIHTLGVLYHALLLACTRGMTRLQRSIMSSLDHWGVIARLPGVNEP